MKSFRLLAAGLLVALFPAWCHAGISPALNGHGGFGISLGVMRWLADADAREFPGDEEFPEGGSAQLRPIGKAMFRYRIDSQWVLSIEIGYGFNGYKNSGDTVLFTIPTTFSLERRIGEIRGATTAVSFGAGAYVWGLRRSGQYLRDPVTYKALHTVDPGILLGLTSEFHVGRAVTFMAALTGNYIFSVHGSDFEGYLGGNKAYADLRIGLNYYFSPYEGFASPGSSEEGQTQ